VWGFVREENANLIRTSGESVPLFFSKVDELVPQPLAVKLGVGCQLTTTAGCQLITTAGGLLMKSRGLTSTGGRHVRLVALLRRVEGPASPFGIWRLGFGVRG